MATPRKDPDGTIRDADTGRILRGTAANAMKAKSGRKPIHNPEDYAQGLIEHFDVDFSRSEVKNTVQGKGDFYKEEFATVANYLPQFEGYAKKLEITAEMLRDWSRAKLEDGVTPKFPAFAAAYTRAKNMQREMLLANALNGYYNPIFAKFVAQNFTELRDKQAIDHTSLGKRMPAPMVYLPEDLPDDYFDKDLPPTLPPVSSK